MSRTQLSGTRPVLKNSPAWAHQKAKLWLSYPLAVDIDSWHLNDTPNELLVHQLKKFEFLQCLQQTPLGEVWRVRSPQRKNYLAHFLVTTEPETVQKFLTKIKAIDHTGLAKFQMIQPEADRFVLLTPLEGKTLKEKFLEYWNAALPGMPRRELLQYLHQTALILDEIYDAHRIQHLALNPKRILIQDGQVQLTEFGFAELLHSQLKEPILALNPQYSAPEIYRNRLSPNCDQCSLALIYVALLTGVHPMRNWERAASGHNFPKTLDLSMLPSRERPIVLKALESNPRLRYTNAVCFLEALEQAGEKNLEDSRPSELSRLLVQSPRLVAKPIYSLESFVRQLLELACQDDASLEMSTTGIPFQIEAGQKIEHRPCLMLPPDKLFQRVEQFGRTMQTKPQYDDHRILMKVSVPASFWRRCFSKPVGLEIEVLMQPRRDDRTEIAVVIRPFGCGRQQAIELLEGEGMRLLAELQKHLHNRPDQRRLPRFAVQKRIMLSPVLAGNDLAPPVEGMTKDVSAGGICIVLPHEISSKHLYVNLPEIQALAPYAGLAEVVRMSKMRNGWYEIGAQFAVDQPPVS